MLSVLSLSLLLFVLEVELIVWDYLLWAAQEEEEEEQMKKMRTHLF
jgi:hypothetical protein